MRSLKTLLLALMLLGLGSPFAASADTLAPVSLSGIEVKLVIPEGMCAMPRDTARGGAFYTFQERVQRGTNRVLLVFGDCGEVARYHAAETDVLLSYGLYLAPEPVRRMTGTRAGLIEAMEARLPSLNRDELDRRLKARTAPEGFSVQPFVQRVGRDANALYMGMVVDVAATDGTAAARRWGVLAITLVAGHAITVNLYGPPDPADPFQRLLARQQHLLAALVRANPD